MSTQCCVAFASRSSFFFEIWSRQSFAKTGHSKHMQASMISWTTCSWKISLFFQFQLFHASFLIQIIRDANLNLSIPFHTNCLSVCLFVFQFLTDQKPLSWIFRVSKVFENCNETFSVRSPQFFTQKVGPEQIERYLRCLY